MILVTGGTGLLGSYLLINLLKENDVITVTKRVNSSFNQIEYLFKKLSDNHNQLLQKIKWIDVDFSDYDSIFDSLENIEYVYHCAAMVSYDSKEKDIMNEINVVGTTNLVNACLDRKIKKLCHVSSIASLGNTQNNTLIDENIYWEEASRSSNYSKSKYLSEMEIWRGITEGLNCVIINPSVILGYTVRLGGSSSLIDYGRKGVKYYTNGGTGFVYANDVAKIMILLMKSEISAERFIVSSENLSWKEFFTIIAKNLNIKPPYRYASSFKTELAWRFAKFISIISNTKPFITKETSRTSHKTSKYSNNKIKESINFELTPIEKAIKEII